ncbi:MAG TPA: hypothetical protein VK306_07160 [Acidimicrobiales bacterium]|nr:hypothetical protein [Acidimicrobiales bacterium]
MEAGAPGAAHDQRRLGGRYGSDDGARGADAHAVRPAGLDPVPPRRPAMPGDPLQGRTPLPHRRSPAPSPSTSVAAGGLDGEGDLEDLAAMMDYLRRDDTSGA